MAAEGVLQFSDLIDTHPITRRQYTAITLCALVMFLDGLDTQAISYMAPTIAKGWGLTRDMVGLIFSSALAGSLIGYLFLAPLSDRFGHRRIIILSTIAFSVFSALSALASNVTELIVLRCLTGIGLGSVIPCAVALTSEYSPKRFRASFVLAIYCGFSLGFVVAGALAAWLLPIFGWRSLFWVGAGAPIMLAFLLWYDLPESAEFLLRQGSNSDSTHRLMSSMSPAYETAAKSGQIGATPVNDKVAITNLFRDGRAIGTILLWIIFSLNLAIFYALQSWLPSILTTLHYSLSETALITTMTTVGGIAAAVVIGPAMDRLGPFRSVSVLLILGVFVLAFMGSALRSPQWIALTTSFLVGVCTSGGQKSLIALSALFYPSSMRSAGVGWAIGIGRIGGIAGPLLPGALMGLGFNEDGVFYGAAAAMFMAGILTAVAGLTARNSHRVGGLDTTLSSA
jgi:AAHS family 4-hydroxybenzoate transporter-like MFS transporter